MSKEIYIGASNTSKSVKAIYVGLSGTAKKVTKGYVGVGGVAKQFFGSSPIWPSAYLGQVITIGSQQYIVVHITSDIVYVALRYAQISGSYSSGSKYYENSRLRTRMENWKNQQIPATYEKYLVSVDHDGVVFPVFPPSTGQLNGGFSYYNSNARRVFADSNGNARDYWTTSYKSGISLNGYVYIVFDDGSISSNPYSVDEWFYDRPHVALSTAAFA